MIPFSFESLFHEGGSLVVRTIQSPQPRYLSAVLVQLPSHVRLVTGSVVVGMWVQKHASKSISFSMQTSFIAADDDDDDGT